MEEEVGRDEDEPANVRGRWSMGGLWVAAGLAVALGWLVLPSEVRTAGVAGTAPVGMTDRSPSDADGVGGSRGVALVVAREGGGKAGKSGKTRPRSRPSGDGENLGRLELWVENFAGAAFSFVAIHRTPDVGADMSTAASLREGVVIRDGGRARVLTLRRRDPQAVASAPDEWLVAGLELREASRSEQRKLGKELIQRAFVAGRKWIARQEGAEWIECAADEQDVLVARVSGDGVDFKFGGGCGADWVVRSGQD